MKTINSSVKQIPFGSRTEADLTEEEKIRNQEMLEYHENLHAKYHAEYLESLKKKSIVVEDVFISPLVTEK